jgi:transmembrane sensor
MEKASTSSSENEEDLEDRASALFLRRRESSGSASDPSDLKATVAEQPEFADAYRRVQASWDAVGRHATSPELMALREQAIARARQASARRWSVPGVRRVRVARWAVAAVALVACGVAWQVSPYGYRPGTYRTGWGEQKVIELSDHSHIALDARTHVRVRFTADARIVELQEGQAQFSVAKDPGRPFKVQAGAKTIVAVGTVFDVQYIDQQVQVAMVEGRVAVLSQAGGGSGTEADAKTSGTSAIELSAGEALEVGADGAATVLPKADIEAATAWREGKVIFRDRTLAEAVKRLNRYSRQQVVIDDRALAQVKVSGVFDAGDAQAFAEAMQAYLPVVVDFSRGSAIHLRMK